MRDLFDKHAVVLGTGKSGVSVALLLKRQGCVVIASDIRENPGADILKQAGIACEIGEHSSEMIKKADMIVKSPGIPDDIPVLREAQSLRIPVYSEIEVSSWFCQAPIFAVTGTNGKTTTTALLGELLKKKYKGTRVGGNIGVPFADFAENVGPGDRVVLELSSFQLDWISSFRPNVAIVLNYTPDHLDRHFSFEAYLQAKNRIFENMTEDDYLIYNADDEYVRRSVEAACAEKIPFGLLKDGLLFIQNFTICYKIADRVHKIAHIDRLAIRGRHNLYNAMAAVAAAMCAQVPVADIAAGLVDFKPIDHRLQFIGAKRGIDFYNDSKATNSNAVNYALMSFSRPVVLLAGGRLKEHDLSEIRPIIEERCKCVCLYGESRHRIKDLLRLSRVKSMLFENLDQAFTSAIECAVRGDVILLSPMCSSVDQFTDFQQRGDYYKKLVQDYCRAGAEDDGENTAE